MIKKAILWLHKWLGILSGIVVFLVSLSAALYTFQDELKLLFYPNKYFLQSDAGAQQPKPLTELIAKAQANLPDKETISRVDLYPAKDRSWVFRASATNAEGFGYWNYQSYYKRVFVNPYTAEVLVVEDTKNEFFQLCLQLHMNLLLGKTYGHALVGYSTAIFALLLLSGMVLWWPKKWRGKPLKRAVSLDWKAKWKRLNYDLHNVFGFYSFAVALVMALTGLVFSFPAFKKAYIDFFNVFATEVVLTDLSQDKASAVPYRYIDPLDNGLSHLLTIYPSADMMSVRLRDKDEPLVDVQIRLAENRSGVFKWYYFRRDNLQVDKIQDSEKLTGGNKLASLNFDLHTGSIGGMPTKIFAFIISMFCASLPITGYILWWQKGRKSTKAKTKRAIR
ncbi:PepSY-associated TM helix domain-containing protein [Sphingobacterium bambusae]|uniref:PepSY-associated TM helix domain-containing protein n=1 Tax=Sphingobacterium bambusae TaxID=662858 RepID=A0ABW6BLC2_9SPHI|nr:PepSY-associated TM helix domain-containing protein [Sphingobacterium bambusae]WPL48211.1 PepSY-associated TM helix domain-containing protein [Sphingobacterium bambusae]